MVMPAANYSDDAYLMRRVSIKPETGCWEWRLSKGRGGYGKASRLGKTLTAHRAIWEERVGPIPSEAILCHQCDNRLCVNPSHMFIGTHQDNSSDMVKKNRQAKGSKINNSKLDEQLVRQVLEAQGTFAEIARQFDLKEGNVRLIRLRKTWRHVSL